MNPLTVHILYNTDNHFGLMNDIIVFKKIINEVQKNLGIPISIEIYDIRQPLKHCDIQIHLEIPIYQAISWAHTNIILVNPEQWYYTFDSYVHAFDIILFRDSDTSTKFYKDFTHKNMDTSSIYTIPWCSDINEIQLLDIYKRYNINGLARSRHIQKTLLNRIHILILLLVLISYLSV
jgi:hypothetical protein